MKWYYFHDGGTKGDLVFYHVSGTKGNKFLDRAQANSAAEAIAIFKKYWIPEEVETYCKFSIEDGIE